MDFKVSYLDPGLTQSYLCDSELPQLYASRMSRRYKTQLRDFLSTCRTKRPYTNLSEGSYNNYNNMYSATPYPADNSLYMQQNLGNLQPLYPASYLPTDNLFSYQRLGTYYSDYMTHGYVSNGYVDPARSCLSYDTTGLSKTPTDQKLYCTTQLDASKYQYKPTDTYTAVYATNSVLPPLDHKYSELRAPSAGNEVRRDEVSSLTTLGVLPASTTPSSLPQKEEVKENTITYTNDTRQTVLMWGSANSVSQDYDTKKYEVLTSMGDSQVITSVGNSCKWGSTTPASTPTPGARSSTGGSPQAGGGSGSPHGPTPATVHATHGGGAGSPAALSGGKVVGSGYSYGEGGEVWHHQYYPYHPYHTTTQ